MTRKPKALHPGARVGVLAPASAPKDPTALDRGLAALAGYGWEPVVGRHARNKLGFLAGTDYERASDLHDFFLDPTIEAIFCARGGYGTTRLLKLLDRKTIAENPKIFVGYSDTTALSAFFFEQCGVLSFYGPMVAVEFAKGATPFIESSFRRAMTLAAPYGPLGRPEGWELVDVVRGGIAEGVLTGGCLTLFESLLGTPYQVSLRDRIFYFEDIDSEPYQTDRMLTHMLDAGMFDGVRGIAVGECVGCEHEVGRSGYDNCQSLRDVISERLGPLGVPIVMGLPFGHGKEKATIPYGVAGMLDGDAGELIITEAVLTAN